MGTKKTFFLLFFNVKTQICVTDLGQLLYVIYADVRLLLHSSKHTVFLNHLFLQYILTELF